jgi:hypothetical protein
MLNYTIKHWFRKKLAFQLIKFRSGSRDLGLGEKFLSEAQKYFCFAKITLKTGQFAKRQPLEPRLSEAMGSQTPIP